MNVLPSATISSLVDLAGEMEQVDGEVRGQEHPRRMRQSQDAADGLLGRQEASVLLVHDNPLFENRGKNDFACWDRQGEIRYGRIHNP